MRLGGHIQKDCPDPHSWIAALQDMNYRAAYCPKIPDGLDPADYALAAREADIVIAEVGVWNNPLNRDSAARSQAIRQCQLKLALAEEIGARCCVNVAGSVGPKWDGPHRDDLTPETFDLIVETVREIIDAVKPKRTFYTLETMPWMYPDSVASYVRLVAAIDRPACAVHFDPVNLICSPRLYFNNAALVREFVAALGPLIKSVHIKDIVLQPHLTTHLDQVRPGLGALDYPALLQALDPLGPDLPIMLEHMSLEEEYRLAALFVRQTASDIGVTV